MVSNLVSTWSTAFAESQGRQEDPAFVDLLVTMSETGVKQAMKYLGSCYADTVHYPV